ncbi:hypothetical protein [Burkholderia sp. AW49-1]
MHLTEKNFIEPVASFAKSHDLIRWHEANRADVVLLDYTLGPGESTAAISSKFFRSLKAISAQNQSAYRRLGIRNDAELFAARKLIEKH